MGTVKNMLAKSLLGTRSRVPKRYNETIHQLLQEPASLNKDPSVILFSNNLETLYCSAEVPVNVLGTNILSGSEMFF